MKYLFLLPALVVGLGLITATTDFLHAEIFTVTTTNASSSGSLPVRIAQANVTPGKNVIKITVTNVIMLGSPLPTISNSLTITGGANNPTVISGGGTLPIFTFAAGTTNSLSNLVLANGYTTNNGAAISNASILSISGCVITNNTAINGFGGAIFNSGSIAISSSVISGNQANGLGGGIYNIGVLSISQSIFVTNCATGGVGQNAGLITAGGGGGGGGFGGALFSASGTVRITNSTFFQNAAIGGNGGGITSSGANSYAGGKGGGGAGGSGGSAGGGGNGGFDSGGGGSSGAGNYYGYPGGSGGYGGGGAGGGAGTSHLGNPGGLGGQSAAWGGAGIQGDNAGDNGGVGGGGAGLGGAIFVQGGSCSLINCTIANNFSNGGLDGNGGNSGQGAAGGVFNYSGAVLLVNTIIAGNNAANSRPDVNGAFISSGFNLIGNNQGATNLSILDFQNVSANLGSLQDNGGSTLTCVPLPGSYAIANGISADAPTIDQRGVPRPQGGAFDIGAVQVVTGSPFVTGAAMVSGSGFSLNTIFDATNKYRIQASTNLTTWIDLVTNSSGGTLYFTDTGATNLNRRFYRTATP